MALPTAKELKKLAAACRKAGIHTFKCGELEFTLGDEPTSTRKGAALRKPPAGSEVSSVIAEDFRTEELTQDQLLMWSAQQMHMDDSGEGSQ